MDILYIMYIYLDTMTLGNMALKLFCSDFNSES